MATTSWPARTSASITCDPTNPEPPVTNTRISLPPVAAHDAHAPIICLIDDVHSIMHGIDIGAIDLNLLVALHALLEEGHVTRAARRMGRTQSATSHALGRLRQILGDPLLVRGPNGMARTARAQALREPLRRALDELGRVLSEGSAFDPSTSDKTFSIACNDLLATALPALLRRIAAEAPSVRLEIGPPSPSAELAIGPAPSEAPGQRMRVAGEVSWVVLARRGHPVKRLDARAWARYPHVQVRVGNPGPSIVDRALAKAGLERRIGVVVPGFLVAPELVAQSDYFFTAPRELVRELSARLELVMHNPPLALPNVPVALIWPEHHHADPAHAWLRAIVASVIEEVLRAPRGRR
jgi:DNA-binding transcriptional LysR family regulator